jgi:hypothetical protein
MRALSLIYFRKVKLFFLRHYLERGTCQLPKKMVSDCIPQCRELEIQRCLKEIGQRPFSIAFDGTCHVVEMMNLVIRFVSSKEGHICQRVMGLKMLQKSLKGKELFAWLVDLICTKFHLSGSNIVATMRDGASVRSNTVATQTLTLLNEKMLDIICLSHVSYTCMLLDQ